VGKLKSADSRERLTAQLRLPWFNVARHHRNV
jgi:hypothetical protein